MRDEWFIRGNVPMTKSEVRAVSISKLELKPDSVLCDVGAGTGSVSIEASFQVPSGQVYAVEQKPEAVELIRANKEKFKADRVTVLEGRAPGMFHLLPPLTHAFIGGSSGAMEEVIDALLEQNPGIRMVINVIAVETFSRVMNLLNRRGIEAEVVLVQVSRAEKTGKVHLMKGQNPVYVISFDGRKKEDGRESEMHDQNQKPDKLDKKEKPYKQDETDKPEVFGF